MLLKGFVKFAKEGRGIRVGLFRNKSTGSYLQERDHLYQQAEDLLGEKMALERQLRQSLGETPEDLRAEEIERVWTPGGESPSTAGWKNAASPPSPAPWSPWQPQM